MVFPIQCEKVHESLLKELNGREAVVKPDDVYTYLQRWGFRQSDMTKILQKVDEIPSDSLNLERKARLSTFLKGIKNKATLDEVKAAFVSAYLQWIFEETTNKTLVSRCRPIYMEQLNDTTINLIEKLIHHCVRKVRKIKPQLE